MLEKPLVHNDEYAYVQERQMKQKLKESSSRRSLSVSNKTMITADNYSQSLAQNDGRIGRFRYTDNQNERVEKQLQTNAIYDPIPNENIHQTFSKIVRRRQENKELAGQFKF